MARPVPRLAHCGGAVVPVWVVAMVGGGEGYGFGVGRARAAVDGMVTGEGTIYPLLARLRRQGLVETTWRESDAGPPRRYYRLAPSGRATLAEFTGSWRLFRDSVDGLLQVGEKGGTT